MKFVFVLVAVVIALAVMGGALVSLGRPARAPPATPANFTRVPADEPPRYFEMVEDTSTPEREFEHESAMNRDGEFYVEGDTIPRIGDGGELLADFQAAEEVDPNGETLRVYDDTTDGDLAKYQDARLQRNRQLQSHSHSVERYHMNRQMVEREIHQSEQSGSWWDKPFD